MTELKEKETNIMTAEKIEQISRYASGVYYKNYNVWSLNNERFEDFKQSLLALAIQFPKDSCSLLMKRYKYAQMCAPEAVPLKIRNMTPFSKLTEDIEDTEQLIEVLGGVYEPFEIPAYNNVVSIIAKQLYENNERRELFLDYMYGQSIGSGKQRTCREKLFNHRFEILKTLLVYGVISVTFYKYYLNIAKQMDKASSVKKNLNMSSGAVAWREYYERNKERLKEKQRERRKKDKQKTKSKGA